MVSKNIINNIFERQLPTDTLSIFLSSKNHSLLEDNRKYRLSKINDLKTFNHRKNNPNVKSKIFLRILLLILELN